MKKLIILLACAASVNVFGADCELTYKTNSDIASCFEKQSFGEVQKAYSNLLNSTKSDSTYAKFATPALVESQKAWLKYRNSYCDSYSSFHTELNNHANCIVELNNARTAQLKADFDAAF